MDFPGSVRPFGDGFTSVMFHEVGHALGLGHAYDQVANLGNGVLNDVLPGDFDVVHLQRIVPPNATDIDLYQFDVARPGRIEIQAIAERLSLPSGLNSVLRVWRQNTDGSRTLVSQNDQYFGNDARVAINVDAAGRYFVGVSSTGNADYDPRLADSGFGGTTDGIYELRIDYTATPIESIRDTGGTLLDGDGDGNPGGVYQFWFDVADTANTFFVNRVNDRIAGADEGTGSLNDPFDSIDAAVAAASTPTAGRKVIRIVGNGGASDGGGVGGDADPATLEDNVPYLLGNSGGVLRDGDGLRVPAGTTVMIDAGALLKLSSANIDVGTSATGPGSNRAGGAVQLLGTPELPVFLRSYRDDTAGGDSDGPGPGASAGNYGGVVFRGDSDLESAGVFLNAVQFADIRDGGGQVFVNSVGQSFSPVSMIDARPSVTFTTIVDNAGAAISASPNSFEETAFDTGVRRVGPEIEGNFIVGNGTDGLNIRIQTLAGNVLERLSVAGRFDDTDIAHVLSQNLIIDGAAGGRLIDAAGNEVARSAGRLRVDPGVVVKSSGARIEASRGQATILAEGTDDAPVVFTSFNDARFGGSGSFVTNGNVATTANAGDWGGLFFSQATTGSLDRVSIEYAGGGQQIDFRVNPIEIHQADVRVANSLLRDNTSGSGGGVRGGLGASTSSVIYVRGAAPVIVDNVIVDNAGAAISLNASSLSSVGNDDLGRSTGSVNRRAESDGNYGPLVAGNRLDGNTINAMVIRGEELTVEGVWDDTDIVHVIDGTVSVDNFHHFGGLRLQSTNTESLVVKATAGSGISVDGTPREIDDRIGGRVHVVGQPGFPVVLTSISDDSIGAGFTPDGSPQNDTNGNGAATTPAAGNWTGIFLGPNSHDGNLAIRIEDEPVSTGGADTNGNLDIAEFLGTLARDAKSGDENSRLGFEVHGVVSPDAPGDVDVYSFAGTAGTPIWVDLDATDPSLHAVVELLDGAGVAVARAFYDPVTETLVNSGGDLTLNPLLGGDFYSTNFRDPGFRTILPSTGTFFLRVRSFTAADNGQAASVQSTGRYRMQLRLQQVDQFPGSVIRHADIRFATNAVRVEGLPRHSPLTGEVQEVIDAPNAIAGVVNGQNLLESDMAALSHAGALLSAGDVDFYDFELRQTGVQVIGGVNDSPGTIAVVFDLDYADGAVRGDTTLAVFSEDGQLIFLGRESNITDDRPSAGGDGQDSEDLSRGSIGDRDPFVGPVHLVPGRRYRVAIMSNGSVPTAAAGTLLSSVGGDANQLMRLEPISSVRRVVEDHIGFTGYDSHGNPIAPTTPAILPIGSATSLAASVRAFTLADVPLYVVTNSNNNGDDFDRLHTANASTGQVQTRVTDNVVSGNDNINSLTVRTDGRLYAFIEVEGTDVNQRQLVEIDPRDGSIITTGLAVNDGLPDPSNGQFRRTNVAVAVGNTAIRDLQFTNSDDVGALVFERVGQTAGNDPTPEYDLYYVVGVGEASRLVRARTGAAEGSVGTKGDATPAQPQGVQPRYGVLGRVQPAGVVFAQTSFSVVNAQSGAVTTATVTAERPGDLGNQTKLEFVFTRRRNVAPNVDVDVVTDIDGDQRIVVELFLNENDQGTIAAGPTLADVVQAINRDVEAKQLATVIITAGDGSGQYQGGTGFVRPFLGGTGTIDTTASVTLTAQQTGGSTAITITTVRAGFDQNGSINVTQSSGGLAANNIPRADVTYNPVTGAIAVTTFNNTAGNGPTPIQIVTAIQSTVDAVDPGRIVVTAAGPLAANPIRLLSGDALVNGSTVNDVLASVTLTGRHGQGAATPISITAVDGGPFSGLAGNGLSVDLLSGDLGTGSVATAIVALDPDTDIITVTTVPNAAGVNPTPNQIAAAINVQLAGIVRSSATGANADRPISTLGDAVLDGAVSDGADATTELLVGQASGTNRIELTATASGAAGNGIDVAITSGPSAATPSASASFNPATRRLTLTIVRDAMNTAPTLQQVIDAINAASPMPLSATAPTATAAQLIEPISVVQASGLVVGAVVDDTPASITLTTRTVAGDNAIVVSTVRRGTGANSSVAVATRFGGLSPTGFPAVSASFDGPTNTLNLTTFLGAGGTGPTTNQIVNQINLAAASIVSAVASGSSLSDPIVVSRGGGLVDGAMNEIPPAPAQPATVTLDARLGDNSLVPLVFETTATGRAANDTFEVRGIALGPVPTPSVNVQYDSSATPPELSITIGTDATGAGPSLQAVINAINAALPAGLTLRPVTVPAGATVTTIGSGGSVSGGQEPGRRTPATPALVRFDVLQALATSSITVRTDAVGTAANGSISLNVVRGTGTTAGVTATLDSSATPAVLTVTLTTGTDGTGPTPNAIALEIEAVAGVTASVTAGAGATRVRRLLW